MSFESDPHPVLPPSEGRGIESIYESRDNRHERSSAAGVAAGVTVRHGGGVVRVVTVRAG